MLTYKKKIHALKCSNNVEHLLWFFSHKSSEVITKLCSHLSHSHLNHIAYYSFCLENVTLWEKRPIENIYFSRDEINRKVLFWYPRAECLLLITEISVFTPIVYLFSSIVYFLLWKNFYVSMSLLFNFFVFRFSR